MSFWPKIFILFLLVSSPWAFAENKTTTAPPSLNKEKAPQPPPLTGGEAKGETSSTTTKASATIESTKPTSPTTTKASATIESTEPASPTTTKTPEETPSTTIESTEPAPTTTKTPPTGETSEPTSPITTKAPTTEETSEPVAPPSQTAEEAPKQSISENFAPQTKKLSFFENMSENISWFFQKKKTPYKIAIIPSFSYNKTQGPLLGLRFASYSSSKKGFYFSASGSKYLLSDFYRGKLHYIGHRGDSFRSESSVVYDNHYENYFGEEGMMADSQSIKLYAHRFKADYRFFYQPSPHYFYGGLGAELFFRAERTQYQDEENPFEDELFVFLKAFAGYDTRDNWKNPQSGSYHQISLGCRPLSKYCKGEMDLRFYLPLFKEMDGPEIFKNTLLALRAFAGSSFLSSASYSLTYSLSGDDPFQNLKALRGFRQNRFRGDKMYFAQSELRVPLWKKYFSGVLFLELGEVAKIEDSFEGLSLSNVSRLTSLFGYGEPFKGLVVDYGAGFRFGIPPDYDIKLRLDFGTGLDKQNERNYDFTLAFFHAF